MAILKVDQSKCKKDGIYTKGPYINQGNLLSRLKHKAMAFI